MSDATVLIVPGLGGSGPDHWQTLWADRRPDCIRVEQADWNDPRPDDWIATIHAAVVDTAGPLVIVAHSLGCLAVAEWAARNTALLARRPVAAMLVAPCDPLQPGACAPILRFAPHARRPLPCRSVLVASTNDPYATIERSFALARLWGAKLLDAGAIGHINAASDLGEWRFGQGVLEALIAGLPPVPASLRNAVSFQEAAAARPLALPRL